jgi:hypothetical protein
MKQFASIDKIDMVILYTLELVSSISVLLLAFGLIASMANVLTKGSVLTDNLFMQHVWAWTQCIAIDASVAGTIIRTFRYHAERDYVKFALHGLLSILLLFTAAIVSNIESVQQTLNLSLNASYMHVFVPVEALIWVRSLAIVLLIVAHALRHVQQGSKHIELARSATQQPTPFVLTPELVDALRAALAQVTITEEQQQDLLASASEQKMNIQETGADKYTKQEVRKGEQQALPVPESEQGANAQETAADEHTGQKVSEDEQEANTAQEVCVGKHDERAVDKDEQRTGTIERESERETNNYERVKVYLTTHPEATDRDIADALTISKSTANKWKKRVKSVGE